MNSQSPFIVQQFHGLFRYVQLLCVAVLCTTLAACGNGSGGAACMTAECQAICATTPSDPICQPACSTQTSCALQGKTCGSIADGCGGSLDCGSCSGWLTCGGGGTENICGASCGAGCPAGYSCDARGVCAGGTPTGLVLDVKTVAVAGQITLNGVAPTSSCTAASPATVQFQEVNQGYTLSIPVACTTSFAFSGRLYPGTYKVTVSGNSNSNLPQGSAFVANPALQLNADKMDLALDVKVVNVDGVVTLNGLPPTSTCTAASPASVRLHEVTRGYDLNIAVSCTTNFAWSGTIYPGTYKVSVQGNANSNLPQGSPFVVNPSLVLTANQAALGLDVKTIALDGKVTLNGLVPTSSCTAASPASVMLQDAAQGYNLTIPVLCNGMFLWSGNIYPGTYKVSVLGNANSNLPQGSAFVTHTALDIRANQKGLALDIKTVVVDGKVTLNGAVPTSTCTGASPATVLFQEATLGYSLSIAVPCNGMFVWSGNIYPGTYKVSVLGNANSNLPQGSAFVAYTGLVITANQKALALDVKTVALDGTVTLNGAVPTSTCTGASPATVTLREVNLGYSINIVVPCSLAFVWSGNVYPGTYKVSVSGNSNSNLPQGAAFVAKTALAVTAAVAGLALDVKTVAVDGKITLNGALATLTCTAASPATVLFTELTQGYVLNTAVPCNPSLAFMSNVYPGTYRVAVSGNSNSNLPQGSPFVAVERLQVP